MRIAIWFLFIVCYSTFVNGQELTPVYENITDGLPSTEVHDIYQDSVGYMWFATDRGICKYDGDRMQIIEVESYLKTKCVFKFFKQKENKVWIVSGKKRLYWFNPHEAKPKFHGYKYNDDLETILANSRFSRNISNILFEGENITVLFRSAPGYLVINQEKGCELFYGQEDVHQIDVFQSDILVKNLNENYYLQLYQKYKKKNNISPSFIEWGVRKIQFPTLGSIKLNHSLGVSCQLSTNQITLIAISDFLILKNNNNKEIKYKKLPSSIISIFQNNDEFLIGTYNGIYKLNSNLEVLDFFFNELSITKIYRDKNGFYWISTLQEGIFLIRSFDSHKLSLKLIFKSHNILPYSDKIILYDNVKREAILINNNNEIIGQFADFYLTNNGIRFQDKNLPGLLNLSSQYRYPNGGILSSKFSIYFHKNVENEKYLYESGAIWKNTNSGLEYFFRNSHSNSITFCTQHNDEKVLVGTSSGLFFLDVASKQMDSEAIKNSENLCFNTFIKLNDKSIFATDKGIYIYSENKLFHNIRETENITGLFKVDEKKAWAYSDNRIFKVKLNNEKVDVSEFRFDFGERNTIILDVAEFNNKLWVATKNGLFIMDPKLESPKQKYGTFKFVLDSLQIKNRFILPKRSLELHSEDNLQLFFNIISFDRTISRTLEYSLDGKNWFETNKNSLTLGNLSFGETFLLIRRIDDPKHVVFKMRINVLRHFYQTVWFKILVSLVGLSVIIFVVNRIVKIREAKKLKELEKLGLELKLLTSKMSPHFTFNTINSIQHFILKSDKKEAINYLSDFALLMRKSLDFSMEERITFQQEREFLKLYVELENKRFNSDFILDFQTNQPIDLETNKIPSMLIQPLVENVILHASYESTDEKLIQIIINLDNGFYTIKIIDFGIGMTKKNRLVKHKSYGLEILRSRVKLYNGDDFLDEHITVEPSDKSTLKGTTITIKLKEWTQ